MASVVYVLCALLSIACATLLFRGWRRNRINLLFWSSLGFVGFALNNILLFADVIVFSSGPDLSVIRTLPALLGMVMLVYGLISEAV